MKKVDLFTNVALLATCGFLCFTLLEGPPQSKAARPEPYRKGDRILAVGEKQFSSAHRTVLVAIRNGCRYCAASMPFYRKLERSVAARKDGRVKMIFLAPGDQAKNSEYLEANALSPDRLMSLSREQAKNLKITGTPTVIVADEKGVVKDVWIGQLNDASEAQVMETLFDGAANSETRAQVVEKR
jgi:hypothetical protein